jgi:hypothetical protein
MIVHVCRDTLLLSELKAIGGAIGDEIQKIEAGEGNLSSDRPTYVDFHVIIVAILSYDQLN